MGFRPKKKKRNYVGCVYQKNIINKKMQGCNSLSDEKMHVQGSRYDWDIIYVFLLKQYIRFQLRTTSVRLHALPI